jgi:hypothetical protein
MGYDQKHFCHGRGSRITPGKRSVRSSKSLAFATDAVIPYGISMAGMSFIAACSRRKAAADSGKS